MNFLLDTHIVMWALIDHPNLPSHIRELILNDDNVIYYSTITPWEVEIKHLKKPDEVKISGERLAYMCDQAGFINLGICNDHIKELKNVGPNDQKVKHNDPFDKMLLAQARSEGMILVTHDKKFNGYNDPHLLTC